MIRNIFYSAVFILASCISVQTHAYVIDANIFYFTDALTADEDTEHSATFYSLLFGFDIDKKGMYQVGWNYAAHATETKINSEETSYKSTQMGPGFVIYFNKDRTFRFGFSYNLKTLSDYKRNSGDSEEWRGTAMNADIGYQFRFDQAFSLGLRLNYSTTSYDESVTETTKEDVTHKKVLIYPSVALTLDSF